MKAIIVTCPHCGARLKVDGTLVGIQCEYCGTSSRIQKRTRVFERVLPPPPEKPGTPHEIAVQRRTLRMSRREPLSETMAGRMPADVRVSVRR